MPNGNAFPDVLHDIAVAIIGGELVPGTRMTLSELEGRFAISRTLARDVVKALEGVGLLSAKRRAGIEVRPRSQWRMLDPQVIAWRLESEDRLTQLTSLTELREAVEPMAAGLAAVRRTPEQAARLVELADELGRLGEQGLGRSDRFLGVDIEYHSLLLEMSGNELMCAMQGMVAEVLRGRVVHGLTPVWPEPGATADHARIARAIAAGDATKAQAISRRQMASVQTELMPSRPSGDR